MVATLMVDGDHYSIVLKIYGGLPNIHFAMITAIITPAFKLGLRT